MTIEQIANLDQYKEHELHDTYNPHCSTCFGENLLVKTCLNCDIPSHYAYCDKCQKLADEQDNDKQN